MEKGLSVKAIDNQIVEINSIAVGDWNLTGLEIKLLLGPSPTIAFRGGIYKSGADISFIEYKSDDKEGILDKDILVRTIHYTLI